jgi:penicillin-binding protein 2
VIDHRDQDRQRAFTRRALLLGGLQLGALGALGGRLYYLQVVERDRYAMLAEDNRISLRLLPPSRGVVSDRHGRVLAVNRQNFRVSIVAEQARDVQRTLDLLSGVIGLSEAELRKVQRDIQRHRRFVPVTVKENLTWEQAATIEVNAPELPGVSIDVGEIRYYPYGPSTAHVLGYVSTVSERELRAEPDPLLTLPGFRIGKNGVERLHDRALRGSAGTTQLEVNAVGRVIRELDRVEGQPGREVRLTLDIGLQEMVQTRLALETSASCVVMDANTGGVYALCSSPSFDPNLFPGGIGAETWEELLADPTAPMTNKAVAGQYAPGSTFKMVVALAALEHGAIAPRQTVFCPGHMELGDHRFHCWKRGGHGHMDMVSAISESCDVYFYELARRLGIDRIHDMALRFGMGAPTGIDLPGERPGLIPNRAWSLGRHGRPWQQGESLVAAIGQGAVLATPLQLAVMTARMVNGGFAVAPHVTMQVAGGAPEQTSWPSLGIPRQHLDVVMRGMFEVTMDRSGTAWRARAEDPALAFAGKTGTSQVRRITMAERERGIVRNEDRPWRHRDHALFVGYAPLQTPRYAVAVVVEHGGGGSAVAAPIARDVIAETLRRDPARGASPVADAGPQRAG